SCPLRIHPMSYLVLARKYRPQNFDDVVGQEHVSQTLTNAIRSNRVAHAFLFTGVRGVGKTTAARILAKALNCERGPTPEPCNQCSNCLEITAGNAVDVLEIDGASNTGVDDVREIIDNVRYRAAKSRFKIYIIDEVHMLSNSAFNALLKTLEEPPEHVKFIFATTDPHKLPATVHSRCQRYDFKRVPLRLVVEQLKKIAVAEGVKISEPALYLIAREGEGSVRDAESLLDQVIAFNAETLSDDEVVAALGIADRRLLLAVGDAIVRREPVPALERVAEIHRFGYDLRRFARDLLEHLRNLAIVKVLPNASDLLADLPDEERAEVTRQAAAINPDDLDRAFRIMLAADEEIAHSPYPKIVLEMALIKLATLAPLLPVEQVLQRIEDLDARLRGDGRAVKAAPARSAPLSVVPVEPVPDPDPRAAVSSPVEGLNWPELVDFVRKEKVTMVTYLEHSQVTRFENELLELAAPEGYYYDYLVHSDHLRTLEELVSRFVNRKVRVKITARAATVAPAAAEAIEKPSRAQQAANVMAHPVVRAAVDILGGELHEVKARPRSERGDG
ncbi:MAG TPA: DNA polymerase III subunit gamma/tau, partial [Candidatus Kryptonia bacterium]|nr:DNA polymerase III subunit gamma/tau [Candidatus Kryptonia bacterium]